MNGCDKPNALDPAQNEMHFQFWYVGSVRKCSFPFTIRRIRWVSFSVASPYFLMTCNCITPYSWEHKYRSDSWHMRSVRCSASRHSGSHALQRSIFGISANVQNFLISSHCSTAKRCGQKTHCSTDAYGCKVMENVNRSNADKLWNVTRMFSSVSINRRALVAPLRQFLSISTLVVCLQRIFFPRTLQPT